MKSCLNDIKSAQNKLENFVEKVKEISEKETKADSTAIVTIFEECKHFKSFFEKLEIGNL